MLIPLELSDHLVGDVEIATFYFGFFIIHIPDFLTNT